MTDAKGANTSLTYDLAGNRTSTTDALNRTNSVIYDALN